MSIEHNALFVLILINLHQIEVYTINTQHKNDKLLKTIVILTRSNVDKIHSRYFQSYASYVENFRQVAFR